MNRAFIILNPRAGRGKGEGLTTSLASAAHAAGWEAVVRTTRRAGEEVDLAAGARRDGWPVVVAVGGDGTVHGVVNGLLAEGPTTTILGHVPVGSGNDYARAIGVKKASIPKVLPKVLAGTPRRMDVGRALGEYFVNGMGAGFDAEVVRQTLRMSHLSGFALYLVAVYKSFGTFRPPDVEVAAPEHAERARMMMLNVSIGPTQGGGFRLAPGAAPDDGLFDVCLIRRVGLLRFLRYVPHVVAGRHGRLREVRIFRTRRIRITGLAGPLPVQLDGELRYPKTDEIEVSILPRHLRVLCAQ